MSQRLWTSATSTPPGPRLALIRLSARPRWAVHFVLSSISRALLAGARIQIVDPERAHSWAQLRCNFALITIASTIAERSFRTRVLQSSPGVHQPTRTAGQYKKVHFSLGNVQWRLASPCWVRPFESFRTFARATEGPIPASGTVGSPKIISCAMYQATSNLVRVSRCDSQNGLNYRSN